MKEVSGDAHLRPTARTSAAAGGSGLPHAFCHLTPELSGGVDSPAKIDAATCAMPTLPFIACHGIGVPRPHLPEDAIEFPPAAAPGTLGQVLPGHQRRHLLGECRGDELINGDVFLLS